jgi:hypothetical protein
VSAVRIGKGNGSGRSMLLWRAKPGIEKLR